MCNPIALGAIAVASGIGQVSAANRAASAESDAATAQYQADRAALLEQRREIGEAGTAEAMDAQREARIEESRVRVAAGEAGGMGAGLQLLLSGVGYESGTRSTRIERNTRRGLAQNRRELVARGRRHYNNLRTIRANTPSPIEAGLAIAGAGVQGYAAGQSIENTRSGKTK